MTGKQCAGSILRGLLSTRRAEAVKATRVIRLLVAVMHALRKQGLQDQGPVHATKQVQRAWIVPQNQRPYLTQQDLILKLKINNDKI